MTTKWPIVGGKLSLLEGDLFFHEEAKLAWKEGIAEIHWNDLSDLDPKKI